MIKRRKALKIFLAAVTTALVPAGAIATTLKGIGSSTTTSLRGQLTSLSGSNFRLTTAEGIAKNAVLIAIDDGPRSSGLEQFSAVFEGANLEEGLHEVYHVQTGSSLISFVSSGEPGAEMIRQRAHFSTFA